MGKYSEAKQWCSTDADKISSYPALKEFIVKNLFSEGEDNPWSVFDRMKARLKSK